MTRLGVAVVGLGVGEQHARAFLRTGRCDLRWLLDHDRAKAERLRAELGAHGVAAGYDQVLKDPGVDIVSIASFDHDHFDQARLALDAGKHVYVEKPLCRTLDEVRSLERAWARQGGRVKLASNLVLRSAPLYRWLREAIARGGLGRIYAIDGDYLYGRVHKITEGWRKDVPDYSVMEGGGVHLLDLMLWLTGERPSRVHALGNRIVTEGTAFRYPDFASAHLEFPSGMVGRVTANFGCVHRHHHVLRVFGTQATFLYDDAGPRIHRTRDPARRAEPLDLAPLPATKGDLIPGFVEAVAQGVDIRQDTLAFLDGIRIAAACDASMRAGAPVEVPTA